MLAFFILPDKLLYELQRFLLQFITLYDKILVSMLAIIFYETMQDNCFFFNLSFTLEWAILMQMVEKSNVLVLLLVYVL